MLELKSKVKSGLENLREVLARDVPRGLFLPLTASLSMFLPQAALIRIFSRHYIHF